MKRKSNKALAKRLKISGGKLGKIFTKKAHKNHLLSAKSPTAKKSFTTTKDKPLDKTRKKSVLAVI